MSVEDAMSVTTLPAASATDATDPRMVEAADAIDALLVDMRCTPCDGC